MKKIATTLLMATAILSLAACGNKSKTTESSKTDSSSQVKKSSTSSSEKNKLSSESTVGEVSSVANEEVKSNENSDQTSSELPQNQSTEVSEPEPKANVSGINLEQVSQGDYSSLIGTWTDINGDTFIINGEIMNRPDENGVGFDKGLIFSNTERDGYPTVLHIQEVKDGVIYAAIGTFNPKAIRSAFAPAVIIPAGKSKGELDDSDSSRDRIIPGGGQSGFKDVAHYRN